MDWKERLQWALVPLLVRYDRLRNGTAFAPLEPRYRDDPYPMYAELRERAPWIRSSLTRGWVVSRYDDVERVLMTPEVFSSRTVATQREAELAAMTAQVEANQRQMQMMLAQMQARSRFTFRGAVILSLGSIARTGGAHGAADRALPRTGEACSARCASSASARCLDCI